MPYYNKIEDYEFKDFYEDLKQFKEEGFCEPSHENILPILNILKSCNYGYKLGYDNTIIRTYWRERWMKFRHSPKEYSLKIFDTLYDNLTELSKIHLSKFFIFLGSIFLCLWFTIIVMSFVANLHYEEEIIIPEEEKIILAFQEKQYIIDNIAARLQEKGYNVTYLEEKNTIYGNKEQAGTWDNLADTYFIGPSENGWFLELQEEQIKLIAETKQYLFENNYIDISVSLTTYSTDGLIILRTRDLILEQNGFLTNGK